MKQSVIELLSPISAPRFSKYSGIQVCYPHRVHSYCYALSTAKSVALTHAPTTAQEWKNCVCLFVNIGDKYGKCYDNNFLNDGIEMTWFGQSAHSFDKPIMQRIMKIRSPADADSIHLFCRYEGEAYIYCGSAVPCCPCIDLCFCPPYRLRVRLRELSHCAPRSRGGSCAKRCLRNNGR